MHWNGKELKTAGDVMDIVTKITDKEEATKFITLYESENPHARENLGYMARYYGDEIAKRIFDLFECEHPIFGKTNPSPEAAFAAGVAMGEKARKERGG